MKGVFIDAFTSLHFFFNGTIFSSVVISKALFRARVGVGMGIATMGSTAMGYSF